MKKLCGIGPYVLDIFKGFFRGLEKGFFRGKFLKGFFRFEKMDGRAGWFKNFLKIYV